ncbi:unnamed protein product [Candidula unifasciata]|uniref:SNF-related serine/threonine-protein kinase n=1 Tax=Candidula unifasciata TaxID=100452 RepID=A0A8S3YMF8_9EUPU|nr:unnamed protein product [Candidula unifasciata]
MAGRKKGGYDGKIAGLYDLEETIGQGHFAVVKLARHVFTGEKVAVKVIDKQKLDDISRSHLFQEVRCMKLVQHPNVVRLYEVIDTQTKLYLILELGDGDMYDYIMKHNDGLDEVLAKKYFRQIVEAILYCHRLHVVHRDLKPENVVFFNKLGLVKLTDFGFSNVFAPGKKLETSCGSLAYSAPEILLGDSYDPPAVDVWSLGVILFMLVAGRPPFQEANDSETLTMIMDCKYQIPSHVSDSCRNLISKMLVRDPSKRISLEDIERHRWLANEDCVDNMTRINLPLLTREHVSEEDHNYVVQKMVEGKICSREEILHSLDRDAYDHIAATYYLLVERRLRKLQQQEAAAMEAHARSMQKMMPSTSIAAVNKPRLEPLMLSPRTQSSSSEHSDSSSLVHSLVSPPGTHPSPASASPKTTLVTPDAIFAAVRKCSLIREESQDDDDDDDLDDFEMAPSELKPSKSLEILDERISELPTTSSSQIIGLSPMSGNSGQDLASPRRPLKSVCSSPQLLNQIHEENESEDEDDFVPLKLSAPRGRYTHGGLASPEILRKYDQRRRRKGAGQRGTSCSSSDASDTDDTDGRSRKDKLKHKFMHRRDSSDHSSDTDGPNGGNSMGGGGSIGNAGGGSKSNYRSSRRGGGGGDGGGGGGGGNNGDKGGKSHSKQHIFYISDNNSSSEDPTDVDLPLPENDTATAECINNSINVEVSSHSSTTSDDSHKSVVVSVVNKRSQLVRQKPVNGIDTNEQSLDVLQRDFDLMSVSRKLWALSASATLSSPSTNSRAANKVFNSTGIFNGKNKDTSVSSQLTNVGVSPLHSQMTAPFHGHLLSKGKESRSFTKSLDVPDIKDYLDARCRFSVCLGSCGLVMLAHQTTGSTHVNLSKFTSTCCTVDVGTPFIQMDTTCCSVV